MQWCKLSNFDIYTKTVPPLFYYLWLYVLFILRPPKIVDGHHFISYVMGWSESDTKISKMVFLHRHPPGTNLMEIKYSQRKKLLFRW